MQFFFTAFTVLITLLPLPSTGTLPSCRSFCGNIPVNYPFGIDDGCGAPQFRHMFNCSTDLFFTTPSGNYKVQKIDYEKQTIVVYDPAMSTCSILQPHHDLLMTEIQSVIIPPSSDTVFVLLNCSVDSPILNHYRYLCFNFSGHSCDEMYSACNAFRIFHLVSNASSSWSSGTGAGTGSGSPPCCFTGYDTVRFMSMNILDCTHYTTVIGGDDLKGVGPLDWVYGIKLSYSVADTGCDRCKESGGSCGFDTETQGRLCLCSISNNSTRQCGYVGDQGNGRSNMINYFKPFCMVLQIFLYISF